MGNGRWRWITTKRKIDDPVQYILSHWDEVDRMLLKTATGILGSQNLTNTQWDDVWVKRGFLHEQHARQHGRNNHLRVIKVGKKHLHEALCQIAKEETA
jgi:squalene cyclase